MSDGPKRILSSFPGRKNQKPSNNTGEKYVPEKRRQNLAETDKGSYYNQEERLEEFLDHKDKGGFYNGSESNDSNNDDENYNENNEQQQLSEGFANNCRKIVSPILLQELINDFALCKQCSGTLSLAEDVTTTTDKIFEKNSSFYVK